MNDSQSKGPSAVERQVLDYIDAHADEAVEFFRSLVRIQSSDPPGDVREIADVCAEFGRALGMEVEQHEPAPGRVSNVLRLRGAGGGPAFLLNSHLDTFPASDPTAWRHPPFGAEIHDGKVWGVGTRDMKAGLSSALLATQAVVRAGARLRGDVVLTQTADHIKGGGVLGLKYLVDERLVSADFGIYTESNPPLAIELASRGMLRFEITLTGFAKHTKYKVEHSESGKPINAILKAAKLTIALETMEFSNWTPNDYIFGPPVISVNRIAGGFSDTLIADRCVVVVDCRYLPGQDPETVIADVQVVMDRLAREDPEFRAKMKVLLHGEACQVSADTPLVETLQGAIETVIGHRVPLGGAGSTSDMRFLVNDAGIPMVKFMFPSSETGTNEFETIEDFLNTWRVYALMLVRVLG
jgi:acetylornithine deacetylase/succinyl-diaminopimelate desuccinylase-like protein